MGSAFGLGLSTAYIVVFFVLTAPAVSPLAPETVRMKDIADWFLAVLLSGLLLGGLPATFVGAVTGSLFAVVMALHSPLPSRSRSILLGLLIVVPIAAAVNLVFYPSDGTDGGYRFLIGIPTLIYVASTVPATLVMRKRLNISAD